MRLQCQSKVTAKLVGYFKLNFIDSKIYILTLLLNLKLLGALQNKIEDPNSKPGPHWLFLLIKNLELY